MFDLPSRPLLTTGKLLVATECGEPSFRMVAMTAGFARERKVSHSRGNGISGIARDYPAVAARCVSQ